MAPATAAHGSFLLVASVYKSLLFHSQIPTRESANRVLRGARCVLRGDAVRSTSGMVGACWVPASLAECNHVRDCAAFSAELYGMKIAGAFLLRVNGIRIVT